MSDVTVLLDAIQSGDPEAPAQLLPLVYEELRQLATHRLAHETPGQTLQPTALVHEAYLRLVEQGRGQHWDGRAHFFAAAAEAMRRILVDNARRKRTYKRGGGLVRRHLDEAELLAPEPREDLLALDEALTLLAKKDRTAANLVQLRYFGGLQALSPRLTGSTAARQRFVREAQAAAAVRDDNVVAIYAVSEDGPVPYLVMEYINGQTLEQRVRQDKPLDLKEILRIGMQLAGGLAAAHAQGLVHRDIKPANILLENSVQRVKITDFGLARVVSDAGPIPVGGLAGTPLYMSPEQTRGEPTDHRTDLFSLGSVLYTLCAGRPPFRADNTAEVLHRVRADAPQPLREINPHVPQWLCGLIGKLHAKEASARPASAREIADLLSSRLALLQQPSLTPPLAEPVVSIHAAPAGPGPPGVTRSHRLAVALCLVGLLAALAAVAVWLNLSQRGGSEPRNGSETPRKHSGSVEPLELRRESVAPTLLALAGGGDPAKAPPELAAVLGDGRYLLPRVGRTSWMEQSPDGKLLAVPLDEDVVLFDVSTGTYVRSLKGPGGRVGLVTFSRDSQLLAASTWLEQTGGAVRVWGLADDRVLFTNPKPGPTVSWAAAFSGDGQHLFTEGNGRIHVWESRTGAFVQDVPIDPRGVGPMCLSPDGRRLAVAVLFGQCVNVFDWDGKKLTEVRTLTGHSGLIGGVAYSLDGKFLASGDQKEFKLWNAETLELIRSVGTSAQQLAFAPDSQILFAATTADQAKPAHTVTRWDMGAQTELPALSVEVSVDPVRAFHCLSRDGRVLFVAPERGATHVRAIDSRTGKELFPRRGHVAPLNAVALSPDGGTGASGGEDWVVKLWDLATGRVRYSLNIHTAAVCGLAFSPDGKLLASGSRDGTVALWDVGNGTVARALLGHSRSFSRIQFSPDGKTLVAGGEKGIVKLWDVASGQERSPLPGHSGAVRCVAFSADGKLLASGGEDRSVRLHDLVGGSSRKLTVRSAVNDVAFSPDGYTLAAVDDAPEAIVRLWDLETGREKTWEGHTGHVRSVAFSPTGSLVATCAEDGTVRLWDRKAGTSPLRTIGPGPFGGGVGAVAFTPDGRYLATANANGMVYVLRMEPLPSEFESGRATEQ